MKLLWLSFLFGWKVMSAPSLITVSEKSGWVKTGRYEEVIELCAAFEKQYSKKVKCYQYGTTPEGRPMLYLVVSESGLTPKSNEKPVVFFQGGIHPGEIEGKDAGFWLIREILYGNVLPGVLSQLTLVFVPVFNIDGHERFSKWNRPNQNGPEEMGWRVNAQNLNLNRDYMKAETPEMASMLTVLNAWDPILYIDLHATDGAEFQHDVAVLVDPAWTGPEPLKSTAKAIESNLMKALTAKKHLPLWYYPSFEEDDNPESGVAATQMSPRFSQAYWGIRNRIGVLVETHSWKPYKERVQITINVLSSLMEMASVDGGKWKEAARQTDVKSSRIGGTDVALAFDKAEPAQTVEFLGYVYTRTKSEVSGKLWTKYDNTKKQIWKIPVWDGQKVAAAARAPEGGYLVSSGIAALVKHKLELHDIQFKEIKTSLPIREFRVFRATSIKQAKESFEGRIKATLHGEWVSEKHPIASGSLFVPIAQPKARVLMHLLEPNGPDSLLAWGFLNAAFEKKEYMEAYVAEEVARKLLEDPVIRAEFEQKLSAEPAFAESPEARLEFFHRKHPSWDERLNLYPIFKSAEVIEAR